MEGNRLLDFVGTSARLIVGWCILLLCPLVHSQASTRDPADNIQLLASQQRWEEVVRLADKVSPRSADVQLNLAIALVKLERSAEATDAFLAGTRAFPRDQRFPTELAGLAFQQKDYPAAARWLNRAARLAPNDDYINNFLGSVYFLLENQEAALKYWNRVRKPYVEGSSTSPSLRIDAVLLDRAVAWSAADVLTLNQLLTTRARLRNLYVFPVQTVNLAARDDGKFDLSLRLVERHGWGANKWEGLLNTFGGVFGQTVTPQYYNINGSATNLIGSYRWDAEKRRALLTISGPLRRNPRWRYLLAGDLRSENWDVRNYSGTPERLLGSLNLRREAVSASVRSVESGRWSWSTGAEVSHRDYRSLTDPTFPSQVLLEGSQLKHIAQINVEALRIPERRFVLSTTFSSQTARIWSDADHSFVKLQASATADWLPKPQGDDWQMLHRISAGTTWGDAPFDELFILGIERDNDLLLRGHVATHRGRRGNAPIGTRYFLSNWELDKNVFTYKFVNTKLGPFVDTGRITGPATFGSEKWLWDVGAQVKLRVLGARVILSGGKDLRTGREAFYVRLGGWSTPVTR